MDAVKRAGSAAFVAWTAVVLAGCGLDVGPDAEWVAAELVAAPLTMQSGAPANPVVPAAAPTTLRLVSYNVEFGEGPDELAASILGDPAIALGDVFLLQEEEHHPDEARNRTVLLAEQLGLHWLYVPGRMKDDATHGLAILSRYPIEAPQVMALPATDGGDPRIALRADIVVGDLRLHVVDVHLDVRLNINDRIMQLRPSVLDLPDAVIVAGDVNTNPYLWEEGTVPLVPTAQIVDTDQAPVLDDYMRALGFATPSADAGPTQRVLNIESRLDAIYVRGFESTAATVERDVVGSDHWPTWIDLTLP